MKDSPEQTGGRSAAMWKWLAVLGTSLVACVVVVRNCKDTAVEVTKALGKDVIVPAIHAAGEETSKIAEKFKRGTITETFMGTMPKVARESGGLLEIATATATEVFHKKDNKTYDFRFFDVDTGTTHARIDVPVTYRYHLRLRDSWRLDVVSNVCIAYAPQIRPSLPPAIDTEKMVKSVTEPKTRFNGRELLESLEKSITPRLNEFAGDQDHIEVVREKCRLTVAEFVRDWLLHEDQWREDRFTSVKVIFPDENFDLKHFQPPLDLKK